MLGKTACRSMGFSLAVVLAVTLGSAGTARAGGDLPKILAGAAVGYLMYKALDDDDGVRGDRQGRYDPHPRYNPAPRYRQMWQRDRGRRAYDTGYRDGWQDGVEYGYERGWDRGERVGFRRGYRVGYEDSEWDGFVRGRRYQGGGRWHPRVATGYGVGRGYYYP